MLFIAMMDAAALAAVSASGVSLGVNSAMSASLTAGLRAASALATNAPAFCCSLSTVSLARLDRFSFRSLAYSGSWALRDSRDIGVLLGWVRASPSPQPSPAFAGEGAGESGWLGGLQDLVALLPVAGAELVGLQRIEHAQHL